MAITGYGKADKNMIMKMLPNLIEIKTTKNSCKNIRLSLYKKEKI
jgi:Holliday junction resolvasome RuvABC endonuclease subunit